MSELASVYRLNKPSRLNLEVGAALVVDGDCRILVDPGYFTSLEELDQALQQAAGIRLAALTDVFFTHLHYDHYSPLLFELSGLTLHVPQQEYAFIKMLMQHRDDPQRFSAFLQESHEVITPVFLRQFLLYANDPLYCLENIAVANRVHLRQVGEYLSPAVKILDLPGHSPGQLGLEIQSKHGTGIVSGDAVTCLEDYLVGDINHHLIVYDRSKLQDSRQRIGQADFVIPGHGAWFAPRLNSLVTF